MEYRDPNTLVSTGWLADHMEDPDLRLLDGSWHLPPEGRDAEAEYRQEHIPGARFFDIDEIADTECGLPHMAPPAEKFASRMKAMGVGDGHQVVIYDTKGLFSAARVWWLFRLMGKNDVAVLDGGLPKWKAEGREVDDLPPASMERHLTVRRQSHLVKDIGEVAKASRTGSALILDARPRPRFKGEEPEPRPGLKMGHIPGAANLPYTSLLNANGTFKSPPELEKELRKAGVGRARHVITTCGSGVAAAIVSLALEVIGHKRNALYDGSWAEWGMRDDLEIETG